MKRYLTVFMIIALLLLCGCSKNKDASKVSSMPKSYAETYFSYLPAKAATFVLKDNEYPLKVGEKLEEYKLKTLSSKQDENGLKSYKATFSADIKLTGNVAYLQDAEYGDIIKFYPDNPSLIPHLSGDTDALMWGTVLESNNPKELLGITDGVPFFEHKELNVCAVNINFTPNATQTYIEIK